MRANLKLVKVPSAKLHLGGAAPPADMKPADYLAKCTNAWTEPIGKGTRVVWQFNLHEGPYHGTALRKWQIVADASGEVSPFGHYARYCEMALGRSLDDDDLSDPAAIFAGKIFTVRVGYRKTDRPRGGTPSDENALRKKDDADRLRVHEILSLVNL